MAQWSRRSSKEKRVRYEGKAVKGVCCSDGRLRWPRVEECERCAPGKTGVDEKSDDQFAIYPLTKVSMRMRDSECTHCWEGGTHLGAEEARF